MLTSSRNSPLDDLYLPFFTAQWKSELRSQTHAQALPQGARDGAVIINHLRQFFGDTPDLSEDLVSTSHFSCTVDGRSLIVWVHWYDQELKEFNMEQVGAYWMHLEKDLADFRCFYRNLLDDAVGTRLDKIKRVIARPQGEPTSAKAKRKRA